MVESVKFQVDALVCLAKLAPAAERSRRSPLGPSLRDTCMDRRENHSLDALRCVPPIVVLV
jgi:hypothetical protein